MAIDMSKIIEMTDKLVAANAPLLKGELGVIDGVTFQETPEKYTAIVHPEMRDELVKMEIQRIESQRAKIAQRAQDIKMNKYYGEFRNMGSSTQMGQYEAGKTKVIVIGGSMDDIQVFLKSRNLKCKQDEIFGATTNAQPESFEGIKIPNKVKMYWVGSFEKGASFFSILERVAIACL